MSDRKFWVLTVTLVLIIVFCTKGTVISMGNKQRTDENHCYRELEQEYVRYARECLREQGFDNCGVMLTRVTNGDGSREYTMQVHHRRLKQMDGSDKSALQDILSQAEFGQETCTFRYEL